MIRASFYLCGTPPPPPSSTNGDIEQSPTLGGMTIKGDLEKLNGVSVRSTAVPFANE